MGSDGPGRSFQAFQRALLQLKQQGVLLVLVSRNEEADVLDLLCREAAPTEPCPAPASGPPVDWFAPGRFTCVVPPTQPADRDLISVP